MELHWYRLAEVWSNLSIWKVGNYCTIHRRKWDHKYGELPGKCSNFLFKTFYQPCSSSPGKTYPCDIQYTSVSIVLHSDQPLWIPLFSSVVFVILLSHSFWDFISLNAGSRQKETKSILNFALIRISSCSSLNHWIRTTVIHCSFHLLHFFMTDGVKSDGIIHLLCCDFTEYCCWFFGFLNSC